ERLTRLWTECQPTVASYVLSLLRDVHKAEDVVQAVAVTLVTRFHEYDRTRPFLSWAMGIARHKVLHAMRARATDRHQFQEELAEHLKLAFEEEHDDQWGEFRKALHACLAKQRGRIREVLSMRYSLDLQPVEIGRRMGVT